MINVPDIDPADNYSLVGAVKFAFQKSQQNMNSMLPARVIAYDRTTNRAQVQIMINLITTGGQQVPRPQVASVPVFIFGCAGFSISMPLTTGDLGWLIANDRDISLFLQTYEQTPPNTTRMNNFSDGVFLPDAMKSQNINSGNTNDLIIQSNDGSMTIELGTDATNNNAPSVNITGGVINLTLADPVTQFVRIFGNLWLSGTITSPAGTYVPDPLMPVPVPPPYVP